MTAPTLIQTPAELQSRPALGEAAPPVAASPTPIPAPRTPVSPQHAEVWALVQRAQAGDRQAFGDIYARYSDMVFRFVYFRVGNRQLAEDLTSEAFLRALNRIETFTWQGKDVGAWLVTIARNLLFDYYKSGRYRLEAIVPDVLGAEQADRDPLVDPEGVVLDREANAVVHEAVKSLGAEQRQCVVLRFFEGLSVAETAEVMGKNEGAIKALQWRAVRSLARLLAPTP